ncbi:MAG: alpha/beta hydrolase [Denitromonas halophila]|nr:MAG: alpha/beta hydrolase [Denitromonas halophila]TVT74826.1 MAG: alpha/beta hydrolase [Denitromonas halophila]
MSAHLENPIYAYTGGRPAVAGQPTLVFVHGAGHDHSVWNMPARHFAYHGFNVLAPDLPGHGRSQGEPIASIEAIADWLMGWVASQTDGPVILIGHSMGSLVALRAAAQHPNRVAKLVLVGSVAPMPVAAPLLSATLDAPDKAHAMINQWSYTPDHHLGASAQPGMVLTGINRRLMERSAPGVLHTDMSACNAYTAGEADAARIDAPTRLISGERDQMTPPKAARALQAALAKVPGGAHIIVLPNAGHAMMAEAPDAFLDALRGFIVTP